MNNQLINSLISILLSTMSLISAPVLGATSTESNSNISHQEMEIISNVNQTIQALHDDKSDAVWPEYDLAANPIILTFNNGHIFAFNLKSNDSAWKKLTIGDSTVLFSDQDKWGVKDIPMHPKFPIEGQKAFLFKFDMMQVDPYLPFLVLVHEVFHQHQFDHFSSDENTLNGGYRDNLNADNLALMQLEELILVDFLKIQGDSTQDHEKKLEILKNFMAVHQARRATMQNTSISWEQHQQIMEGLADYVSLKTYDVHHILAGFFSDNHLYHTVLGYASDESISDRAIKWRHYGVGAAMGFALDFLNVKDWKEQVQDQGAALDDMLIKTLALPDADLAQRLQQAKLHYGYDSIRNKVTVQLNAYEKELSGHFKAYDSQDGICIILNKPQNSSVSGGGSNKHLYYLSSGGTLAIRESSENRTMDNLWGVTFKEQTFVFQGRDGTREFKVENDVVVILDGQSFKLKDLIADNVEKKFSTISWVDKKSAFQSEQHSGKLMAKNGKVIIAF